MPDKTTSKPVQSAAGIHLRVNPQWEVHPAQLKQHLDRQEELLILDVRRPIEFDVVHFAGAKLIPLDQLAARIAELSPWQNKRIVAHCHHGMRSLNATAILRQHGFTNVHSLAGGIDAWSLLIDPGLPRY